MTPQNETESTPAATDEAAVVTDECLTTADAPEQPELPAGAQQILKLIQEIEALRRSVESLASNNVFITAVAKRLVDSEALAPLIERIMSEFHHTLASRPPATFQGLACQLFENVEDESKFNARVMRHPDNHPLNPGGLEFYILEHGEWHAHGVQDLAARAIIDAMEKMDAKRGVVYWCLLHQVWDNPATGLNNVRITAEDTVAANDEPSDAPHPEAEGSQIGQDAADPAVE